MLMGKNFQYQKLFLFRMFLNHLITACEFLQLVNLDGRKNITVNFLPIEHFSEVTTTKRIPWKLLIVEHFQVSRTNTERFNMNYPIQSKEDYKIQLVSKTEKIIKE